MDKLDVKSYLENLVKNSKLFVENKLLILDNQITKREEYYLLKNHIDNFLENNNENRFFIMSGIRSIGKTTILYQLYNYLTSLKEVSPRNILYLNLYRLRDLGEYDICEFFNAYKNDFNFKKDEKLFIFVDESQFLNNLNTVEEWINSNENIFIIFAGSNVISYELDSNSKKNTIIKMYPLNFIEYLNLNYNYNIKTNFKKSLTNIILSGEIADFNEKITKEIQKHKDEWKNFLQYNSFPFSSKMNFYLQLDETLDIKNEIIEKDLDSISPFTSLSRKQAYPLLNLLVLENIENLALNKLANRLNISKKNVSNLLYAFEKIQILFHVEPYVPSGKNVRKAWKYYFISTQFKVAISQSVYDKNKNLDKYKKIISENLVASALYKNKQNNYELFYDASDNAVPFLIKINEKIIPIDINKNKERLELAIEKFNSEFGILVSEKLHTITVDNKIIKVPLAIFSCI